MSADEKNPYRWIWRPWIALGIVGVAIGVLQMVMGMSDDEGRGIGVLLSAVVFMLLPACGFRWLMKGDW